jgi:hypothetical protein
MTPEVAHRNAPMHREPGTAPCAVTVGGAELTELVRQSTEYAAFLAGKQRKARELIVPGDDHFTILERLARADGVFTNEVLKLLA